MGIIFLALISYGAVSKTAAMPPLWVIVCCALAMAAGTYLGGWRIIRTLGKGLVEIKSPQGMAAESSSAAVILLSAHFGYALSTTRSAPVRAGQRAGQARRRGALGRGRPDGVAWLVTLPLAGLVGAVTYWIVHLVGGYPGAILGFALLVAVSAVIYIRSRRARSTPRTSTTTGKAASPPDSRLRQTANRRPIRGQGRHRGADRSATTP